jgi:hypothetical protein
MAPKGESHTKKKYLKKVKENNFISFFSFVLFQLYLLFNQLQTHSVSDILIDFPEDYQKRQIISVIISVLALVPNQCFQFPNVMNG